MNRTRGAFLALVILLAVVGPAGGAPTAPAAPASPLLTADERRQVLATLSGAGETVSAMDDASLERALIAYARRELGLRLRPRTIDPLWGLEPAVRDPSAEFRAARATGGLGSWLKGIQRSEEGYVFLREAAKAYAAAAGRPFEPLSAAVVLREGTVHPEVEALRRRLSEEGIALPPAAEPAVFDAGLKEALAEFQARRGLLVDGVLGPRTRDALNVTPAQRLDQIEANLERLRWLPHDLSGNRLEVNIAAAEATLFQRDRPLLTMRIVVGDLRHKTPMFASRIETVVLNPPWNVPASIARNEILPRAARDPGYLARNHFAVVDGRLQQRPGPDNALGELKFDLPSPYGVYLHDTPGRSAFQQTVRALSHGCMRLENPRELALALLGQQGWTVASLASAIDSGATRRVDLQRPLPLFVTYQTAMADKDGGMRFVPDRYGWDAKLSAALAGAQRSNASAAPPPECGA